MPSFAVVLVEPKYEGNIGSVARVMKNFGLSELVLINPPEIGKEGRSMAMHGREILEKARKYSSFSEAAKYFDFLVATSAIAATDKNPLRTPVFPEYLSNAFSIEGRIALVFGREDYGLHNDEIEACDLLVFIPTSEEYPTLNVSHAVAVILYELRKSTLAEEKRRFKKFKEAGAIEKRVLLEKFDSFVDKIHEKRYEAWLAKKTFRQLLGRAFISGREAFTLTGLFRKAANKIK